MLVSYNPTVASGIFKFERSHDHHGAVLGEMLNQPLHHGAVHEWSITGRNHHRTLVLTKEFLALGHGMPGSQLLVLPDIVATISEKLFDKLPAMPDDHGGTLDARILQSPYRVLNHRQATHRVENLREFRFHSGAFSGSKDDSSETLGHNAIGHGP